MDLITVEEVQKAPLGTKVMLYGVAIDKARDMEGSNRPVFNIGSIVMDAQRTIASMDRQFTSINSSEGTTEQKALTENAI